MEHEFTASSHDLVTTAAVLDTVERPSGGSAGAAKGGAVPARLLELSLRADRRLGAPRGRMP